MGKKNVIIIFDIGKTNKKVLLFDERLTVVYQKEEKLPTIVDEDGFECDDIGRIENWISNTLSILAEGSEYNVSAVNFSTYGASLVFLDGEGNRLSPLYNYLKQIDPSLQQGLFNAYGGETEFCRNTASPALGLLLNSGIQIFWFKQTKADSFRKVKAILHFPQYLYYFLTRKIVSEYTSIGCHTFLWDFDKHSYHSWVKDHDISLPDPVQNTERTIIHVAGKKIPVGIGIHDSSASLAPYLRATETPFMLISTGTWCINMNPFNHTPLTAEQLKKDCLCYLSINQQPVKSSRLFMGHIHDVNTRRISEHFNVPDDRFKQVKADEKLMMRYVAEGRNKRVFFKEGMPDNFIDESIDLSQFDDFAEAYNRLVFDLTALNAESIDLVSDPNDGVKQFYVSGGFARNELFVRLVAHFYPDKEVYTTQIDNSSALGAALMVWDSISEKGSPLIDLGLTKWKGFKA